jgi:hypothetical protein
MTLALPLVLAQVVISGAIPAVAMSSEPEISASFIAAAPLNCSHSIFGAGRPDFSAAFSISPFCWATISGK